MHFSFKFNFVSLPDESSRMLLKRRTLFFGLTDADKRETEIVKNNNYLERRAHQTLPSWRGHTRSFPPHHTPPWGGYTRPSPPGRHTRLSPGEGTPDSPLGKAHHRDLPGETLPSWRGDTRPLGRAHQTLPTAGKQCI